MASSTIAVTDADAKKLRDLIFRARAYGSVEQGALAGLERELDRAAVVDPKTIPPDTVTMNSKFRVRDLDSGDEYVFSLVYPDDADISEGRLSVLAPVGTGLLGYRAGDTVVWPVPAGVRRLKIEGVLYQPEASGDFNL
ncbi:MAG: nucleoside diphosphate kinase regulator [Elusimicrobiota bacterium]|jgi:regulator of nucleoside diphosphate kinase